MIGRPFGSMKELDQTRRSFTKLFLSDCSGQLLVGACLSIRVRRAKENKKKGRQGSFSGRRSHAQGP